MHLVIVANDEWLVCFCAHTSLERCTTHSIALTHPKCRQNQCTPVGIHT